MAHQNQMAAAPTLPVEAQAQRQVAEAVPVAVELVQRQAVELEKRQAAEPVASTVEPEASMVGPEAQAVFVQAVVSLK